MQKLFIAGTVGKDAVLRRTQNGDPILGFSVAVNNGKDKDATWYDCAVFGKRATALEKHVTKGSRLALSGRPMVRVYEGKAYLGISIDDLAFQGGNQSQSDDRDSYGNRHNDDLDDDVPF
jgi:single-strand DNA-binding protein